MSDTEYDIDELTAFLEADDDEFEDSPQLAKETNSHSQDKESDECDLDEITAFLEASDSEEEEDGCNLSEQVPPEANSGAERGDVDRQALQADTIDNDDRNVEDDKEILQTDITDQDDGRSDKEIEEVNKQVEPTDEDNTDSSEEDEPDNQDRIKAELELMREKMQQLEQMLSSSQKKKEKKTSPKHSREKSSPKQSHEKHSRKHSNNGHSSLHSDKNIPKQTCKEECLNRTPKECSQPSLENTSKCKERNSASKLGQNGHSHVLGEGTHRKDLSHRKDAVSKLDKAFDDKKRSIRTSSCKTSESSHSSEHKKFSGSSDSLMKDRVKNSLSNQLSHSAPAKSGSTTHHAVHSTGKVGSGREQSTVSKHEDDRHKAGERKSHWSPKVCLKEDNSDENPFFSRSPSLNRNSDVHQKKLSHSSSRTLSSPSSSTCSSKTSVSASSPRTSIQSKGSLSVSRGASASGSQSNSLSCSSSSKVPGPAAEEEDMAVDAKTLFGDSDSDWEDLDGETKPKLTEEGKTLKNLLTTGPRKREAHAPSYDLECLKKSSPAPSFYKKPSFLDKPMREAELKPKKKLMSEDKDTVSDPFSGIKIVNPRVSSLELKGKMEGRTMIRLSRLASKINTADMQNNWVTIGVVVHKTEARQSSSGKTYCIWRLSDLQDCEKVISFFLFGNVFKDHWKNDVGTVVGLLNPNLMDKAEKKQSELAFTINNPLQLLVLGKSRDLGKCAGTTKAGNPCTNFINVLQGEYCSFHVQAAYKKSCSKRSDLQQGYTGVTPKAFQQKVLKKGGCFFYGGETFTELRPANKGTKDKVTLKKLQEQQTRQDKNKVTTMSLHDLDPEDEAKLKKLSSSKDNNFLEMLTTPTVGSMNLVKHIVKKEKLEKEKKTAVTHQSVTPTELLKKYKEEMKDKIQSKKNAGKVLGITPTLGKGFYPGQEVSLDVPTKKSSKVDAAELAKKIAISKIKAAGGVEKEDPNTVKKKKMSPESKEKVKKRIAEAMETDKVADNEMQPPRKKSRFLGNVDLNDPEVQRLLKAKSIHKGAVAEVEAEHEDRYFMAQEKKEKYEDKMSSITEMPCKIYTCKQCNYSALSTGETCKKENHEIKIIKGTKRFFVCKDCKKRCISLDRYPKACKGCGGHSFEKTSMWKEKSGPKLESEILSLRGDEEKFLGAMQQQSFLNLP